MKVFRMALVLCLVLTGAYAQVDRDELQKNLAPVTFYNFEGPHARIESREQIRQIGAGLGQSVQAGSARSGASNRYFVIHAVSAPDGTKLDADIFGLGPNAGVDHIRNLRSIIQGYLQSAYTYSEKDAALLAEYITIYNAVYRGNWNYFSGRYKAAVLQHINARQAGLSTRYTEWPGNTLMLIPLGAGGLSAVDTSAISDDRVVQELRKEDDRGVEQRRNMVDLKEREAEAAEKKAADQKKESAKEEKAIAEERSQLEKERQQTEADKKSGAISEKEAAERETAADEKEKALDEREEELALQREEAAKQEQLAEKKSGEAQSERESIAKDQQAVIDQGEQPQAVIGVALERSGVTMGRLISFNPATKQEIRRSPLETVYVRTLTFIDGKILAIAGENKGNSAVRLIEINGRSLEMVKQGDDDMHPGSLIWVNGSDLYAITANLANGTYNLGRFNGNLVLQAQSAITINPNASVHVQGSSLLTQQADGKAVLLDPATLAAR